MLLSPAGSVAQPVQSVRRMQQQERVGVHVGCNEAPEVEEGKCWLVRTACCFRYSACIHSCMCVWAVMLLSEMAVHDVLEGMSALF